MESETMDECSVCRYYLECTNTTPCVPMTDPLSVIVSYSYSYKETDDDL
jgi:hypothetical protein